jgi:hypothetical protein
LNDKKTLETRLPGGFLVFVVADWSQKIRKKPQTFVERPAAIIRESLLRG